MNFKYPCFISYATGKGELLVGFRDALQRALEASLDPYFTQDLWIDRDKLRPGDAIDQALAQAICESICTVVVFVPKYNASDWCMRELATALRIERRRLDNRAVGFDGADRFVIPLILRGTTEDLPSPLRSRVWGNFTDFTLHNMDVTSVQSYVRCFEDIAKHTYDMFRKLQNASAQLAFDSCANCVLEQPFAPEVTSQAFPFR